MVFPADLRFVFDWTHADPNRCALDYFSVAATDT